MFFVKISKEHYTQVSKIYAQGLDTGISTFETEIPTWEKWDKKYHNFGRVAIQLDNEIIAWGALSPVSARAVYKGVAEVSLYVGMEYRGKGFGKKVLLELIRLSELNEIWTLQSGIFRENKGSYHLHLDSGFREIGYRERIAQREGIWYDNVLMERRSTVVG